ncbi:MAG TPA: class IV adenylate cyclase [Gemmatimonadaceae bacterium]|jgi:predicted adenylyl cyclase CyaB|nr:class IV adenylate cyclase [Gemmatimonadaceae bacterium]
MREVELKAVVDDLAARREKLENAGAILEYEGMLLDRRYDLDSGELSSRDEVLRVRSYVRGRSVTSYLDWKGATEIRDVYKTREEISTKVDDAEGLAEILGRLGFVVTMAIDREIAQYRVHGATVRFETYPRMDILVEVEGEPEAIEEAIGALGIARGQFTSERLASFVQRFENRTGVRAAISRDRAEARKS